MPSKLKWSKLYIASINTSRILNSFKIEKKKLEKIPFRIIFNVTYIKVQKKTIHSKHVTTNHSNKVCSLQYHDSLK